MLVLSTGQQAAQDEVQEELDYREQLERLAGELQENLLERLTIQERKLEKIEKALARLTHRVDELEGSLAIVDAGLRALSQLLDRRKILRETELMNAWEREAATEAALHEVVEKLEEQREVILARAKSLGARAESAYRRALDSANLLFAAGKISRALLRLATTLRTYPRNPEMAQLLGELAMRHGEYAAAREAYGLLVQWDPKNVDALVTLATLLADEGQVSQAERYLKRALRAARGSFLPSFALGALKVAQEKLPEARRLLKRALAQQESPVALFLMGLVEFRLGRLGAAAQLLKRTVMLAPKFEEAMYTLGLVYLERGFTRKALACFQEVLKLDPQRLRYQEAVRVLVAPEYRQELPKEVAAALEGTAAASESGKVLAAWKGLVQVLEVSPHPTLEAAAALVASTLGARREAVHRAHRVLRQVNEGPARTAAWTALFETLRAAGRHGFLVTLANRLLKSDEGDLVRGLASYELALALSEAGKDLSLAEELAHQAMALFPSELQPYAQAALGRVFLAQERFQDAVDYLELAAAAAPSPQILAQLGLALLAVGEKQRARQVLQRARAGKGTDLQADVLAHLLRVAWLSMRRS